MNPSQAPLPAKLPPMRPERMTQLIAWADHQDALPWLLQRSADYWAKFHPEAEGWNGDPPARDELHRHCDAAAALDLLRERTGAVTNRQAVDILDAKQAGCAEVAESVGGRR